MDGRPEIPDNITHTEYFNRLLRDRVNKSTIPKISNLNAIIQFNVTDNGNGIWNVIVENGFVKEVTMETHHKPTCAFTMNSATFISIIKREVTPQQAFFARKVDINGNMLLSL